MRGGCLRAGRACGLRCCVHGLLGREQGRGAAEWSGGDMCEGRVCVREEGMCVRGGYVC